MDRNTSPADARLDAISTVRCVGDFLLSEYIDPARRECYLQALEECAASVLGWGTPSMENWTDAFYIACKADSDVQKALAGFESFFSAE